MTNPYLTPECIEAAAKAMFEREYAYISWDDAIAHVGDEDWSHVTKHIEPCRNRSRAALQAALGRE